MPFWPRQPGGISASAGPSCSAGKARHVPAPRGDLDPGLGADRLHPRFDPVDLGHGCPGGPVGVGFVPGTHARWTARNCNHLAVMLCAVPPGSCPTLRRGVGRVVGVRRVVSTRPRPPRSPAVGPVDQARAPLHDRRDAGCRRSRNAPRSRGNADPNPTPPLWPLTMPQLVGSPMMASARLGHCGPASPPSHRRRADAARFPVVARQAQLQRPLHRRRRCALDRRGSDRQRVVALSSVAMCARAPRLKGLGPPSPLIFLTVKGVGDPGLPVDRHHVGVAPTRSRPPPVLAGRPTLA